MKYRWAHYIFTAANLAAKFAADENHGPLMNSQNDIIINIVSSIYL